MDEAELDEQFEATEYDGKGNIITPPAPPPAAKRKRTTIAELKERIDTIEEILNNNILAWLRDHDSRIGELETGSLLDRKDVAADIADRLEQNEATLKTIIGPAHNELHHQLDNQDAAIGALSDALRSHLEEVAATPPEPPTEIEFAAPPPQTAGGQIRTSDLVVVANASTTMNDVLMTCRILKDIPELTDNERKDLLSVACRSSGVIVTPGLQIRAGVTFTGA